VKETVCGAISMVEEWALLHGRLTALQQLTEKYGNGQNAASKILPKEFETALHALNIVAEGIRNDIV
jgi:hypothetical protein